MKIRYLIGVVALCSLRAMNLFANCPPVDCVDPMIGTGFHGHTYPGATVPFGAVQLSPDTRTGNWDACSGYHYSDSTLIGFSHTHLSGTGCIDLGDILLRPSVCPPMADVEQPYLPASFSHADEQAFPGYYSVFLPSEGIRAELTATTHVGVHRYTYPLGKPAYVWVDLKHMLDNETLLASSLEQTSANELSGMRITRGWVDGQHIYFVARFSHPFRSVEFRRNGKKEQVNHMEGGDLQAAVEFDLSDGEPLVVRVGISIISIDEARRNLESETPKSDFDIVKKASYQEWNKALSVITVKDEKPKELKNFYTSLYHAMVVPNIVSDADGKYYRYGDQVAQLPAGQVQYSTFSLWDTFRSWNPFMTLVDTTRVNHMIQSFLRIYDMSGELPIWPLSSGETGTMIGYHAVSVIADAYLKGIRGFDSEKALEAMVVSARKNAKGAEYYQQLGFIPSNIKKESISCLLEFAYDDWCIARMAQAMGKVNIAQECMKRALNYVNVFDGGTRFFRPKRLDGNWESPFNPLEVGRAYTEATAWQYRFFVPHDVNGMMQLFGGKGELIQALDSIFTIDAKVQGELQDITGLIGQYAHGNEPSHHIAYLYNYVGQPWKTQEMTRRLLDEMYAPTPEGIIGNEDCGQMSAWYILSAMGFYSVCPGSNEFCLTTPLFDLVELKLANGKILTVKANNPAQNKYIDKVTLNGRVIDKNFITYEQLMQGGELSFTLSSKPNYVRGTQAEDFPYSFTKGKVVSVPYVNKDLNLFLDEIEVQLASATEGSSIHYTLDGTEPGASSPVYTQPFTLDKTTTVKARAFKNGYEPSRILTIQATKAELLPPVAAEGKKQGTSYTYVEGYFQKVADLANAEVMEKGVMAEPSIRQAKQADHFGYIFEGIINVPEDGVYTFATKSDDGSVLYVDGNKVVDNDSSHAAITATGRIALKKGFHSYRLLYFEDYEGEHLSWEWTLPGKQVSESIPLKALFLE